MHGAQSAASSLQRKVTPGSGLAKANEGLAFEEAEFLAGPEVIVARGATVSTVKDRLTTGPTFPAASIALTANAWGPSASRWGGVNGDAHLRNGCDP